MARLKPPRKLNSVDRFKYQPSQPGLANTGTSQIWPSFQLGGLGGLPLKQPTFTADAILKKPGQAGSFTANAVIVSFIGSFTADADLKKTVGFDRPVWIAAGAPVSTPSSTLTPPMPTGWAVDDILLITHFNRSGPGTPPSGWSEIIVGGKAMSGQGGRIQVYWRRAVSGDTAPTLGAVGNADAQMAAVRGAIASGNPYESETGAVNNTAGTSFASTGLTTLGDGRLVWVSVGRSGDNGSPQFSNWAGSNLVNISERQDDGFTDGTGGGIAVATGEQNNAGSSGPFTADIGISVTTAWIEFALIPQIRGSSATTFDAVLLKSQPSSFTANAVISTTVNSSFTADSSLTTAPATINGSLAADSILKKAVSSSLPADSIIKAAISGSATANAVLKTTDNAGSFTADGVIATAAGTHSDSFIADSILKTTQSSSIAADSILNKTASSSLTADAILRKSASSSFTANAIKRIIVSGSKTADAILKKTISGRSFTADSYIVYNRMRHNRWTEHIGLDHTGDHILAQAFGQYLKDEDFESVLAEIEARITAREGHYRHSTGHLRMNAITKSTQSGSFSADAVLV